MSWLLKMKLELHYTGPVAFISVSNRPTNLVMLTCKYGCKGLPKTQPWGMPSQSAFDFFVHFPVWSCDAMSNMHSENCSWLVDSWGYSFRRLTWGEIICTIFVFRSRAFFVFCVFLFDFNSVCTVQCHRLCYAERASRVYQCESGNTCFQVNK